MPDMFFVSSTVFDGNETVTISWVSRPNVAAYTLSLSSGAMVRNDAVCDIIDLGEAAKLIGCGQTGQVRTSAHKSAPLGGGKHSSGRKHSASLPANATTRFAFFSGNGIQHAQGKRHVDLRTFSQHH